MKLTTKTLFTFPKYPIKKSPKSIKKLIHSNKTFQKPQLNKIFISSTKKNEKENEIKERTKGIKIISLKKNAINKKGKKPLIQKKVNRFELLNSKTQEINFEFCKRNNIYDNYFDDDLSELNNYIPTMETESNRHIKNDEFNIDELYDAFKNSELKTTIILDNNGNNNLNYEQKKFIENYFYKKKELGNNIKKCKINSIKVDKYHSNYISKKVKNSQVQNKDKFNFKNLKLNISKKTIQFPFGKLANRYIQGKKILPMKDNVLKKDLFGMKNEEEKSESDIINNDDDDNDESKDNNSIFEDFMNKSSDSSFINPSEGENLVLAFRESAS